MNIRKAIEDTIKWGNLPVEVEDVDPHRLGWQRHPSGQSRTWTTDTGEIYIFAPNIPEKIAQLKLRDD